MSATAPTVQCAECGRRLRAKTTLPSHCGPYYYLRRHKTPDGKRCPCDTSILVDTATTRHERLSTIAT